MQVHGSLFPVRWLSPRGKRSLTLGGDRCWGRAEEDAERRKQHAGRSSHRACVVEESRTNRILASKKREGKQNIEPVVSWVARVIQEQLKLALCGRVVRSGEGGTTRSGSLRKLHTSVLGGGSVDN